MKLPDQEMRDRFACDTGQNFSVIAPAGVGKTTAIAQRVLAIAQADARAREHARAQGKSPPSPVLPRLVVVTYTRKAADELRSRARQKIIEASLPPLVLGWFNDAFFGTIHSFCIELLRRFGPLAGLPARFTIETDDTALRLAFQRDTPDVTALLPVEVVAAFRRLGGAEIIWPLVWNCPSGAKPSAPGPCPTLGFSAIESFKQKKKRSDSLENIELSRKRLSRWREAGANTRALGIPEVAGGGAEFVAVWNETFQPLREWLAACAAHAAFGLAEAFAKFKLQRSCLNYDDLARTALRLLRDPAVGERIRAQGYSVLLDEAQDTDPAQFAVLLGAVQPLGAPGLWLGGAGAPPAPGRFSMVGDPQQSIYRRSDVGVYRRLHGQLQQVAAAEALTFSVTMRCDEMIVTRVNERFAKVLHERKGQVGFVRLQSRPDAGPGSVWRLPVAVPENYPAKPKAADKARAEARSLARWLATAGPAGIGADSWAQVAVLAPRRDWLEAVELELRDAGVDAQLHSGGREPGANPARTWLGALLGMLADPGDVFERIGVLREIFGISDDEIFHWRNGNATSQALAAAQNLLNQLTRQISTLPLREAVTLAASAVCLRERLAILPEPPEPGALEALLDQAALADLRGEALADFARSLQHGPIEAVEVAARSTAVQLLTNHKAKGLEWQAVIQFGLFLDPRFAAPHYPRWQPPATPGAPPTCLLDKAHAADDEASARLERDTRRAEFERILYVAATRPRHALILVDAELLAEKVPAGSLANILDVVDGASARNWWKQLPELGQATRKKSATSAKPAPKAAPGIRWPQADWHPEMFADIATLAQRFTRRVRPSTLARHTAAASASRAEPDLSAPPEFPEEQPVPTAAVAYGNWWHGLMEDTPWSAGRDAWKKFWNNKLADAPEPERARTETTLLLDSPLAARLVAPGLEFAVEVPFLWAGPDDARAFDGCVDFAAWDGKNSRWLVVDWKTDRVAGGGAELRQRYGPQIEVYARALAAMTEASVEAFLYGTRSGELTKV